MILPIKHMTPEEYKEFKETNFYFKKDPPEIEVTLQKHQEQILLHANYEVLPEFKKDLTNYARSLLLKRIKGSSEYIDPIDVEAMSEEAADNFLKRYFRNDEPIVGASFAGILFFKVGEVLSVYFKSRGIISTVSLDDTYGGKDEESSVSKETVLSYKEYLKHIGDDFGVEDKAEIVFEKLEKELQFLQQLDDFEKADTTFLKYLLYISLLQKTREDKKLTMICSLAMKLLDKKNDSQRWAPLMESALLDCRGAA